MRHLIKIKISVRFFIMFILCGVLLSGCVLFSDRRAGDAFSKQYKDYQVVASAGYAAINRKEYSAAIAYYTRAINVSPFEPDHYYYRGLAWYKKGNMEKAGKDFDKVIILDPRWRSAFIYRGLCSMKTDNYAGALSDYQSALNLKYDDANVHNNLAWLYATATDEKFRDTIKALEHAGKAAALSQEKNAEILDTLARVYFINGKVSEAITTQKKALALEPDNLKFQKNLEQYENEMKE